MKIISKPAAAHGSSSINLEIAEEKDEKNLNDKLRSIGGARHVCLVLLGIMSISLLFTGCGQVLSPTEAPSATPPIVEVTQIVTEIIPPTPVPETPKPTKTATPEPATITPTWDPLSAPIYYPIKDCIASRLHVGDKAMVSYVGGANGIRYGQDISQDTIIAYAQPGAILEIVTGPYCSRGWIVWFVRMADGTVGFTPEGDGNEYWLLPVR
jgi:hypothetical protein